MDVSHVMYHVVWMCTGVCINHWNIVRQLLWRVMWWIYHVVCHVMYHVGWICSGVCINHWDIIRQLLWRVTWWMYHWYVMWCITWCGYAVVCGLMAMEYNQATSVVCHVVRVVVKSVKYNQTHKLNAMWCVRCIKCFICVWGCISVYP